MSAATHAAADGADFRRRLTVEAIRAWRAARDLRDEVAELAASDRDSEPWWELASAATDNAERSLLGVIPVATEVIPPDRVAEVVYEAHPPRAIEHDGRHYIAVSAPGLAPGEGDDGEQVVHLVVIEASGIARPAGPDPVAIAHASTREDAA